MTTTEEFIFTFPIADTARCDSFVRVRAEDETAARLRVIDTYGRDGWAFCYRLGEDTDEMVARHHLHEIEFGQ